MRNPRLDSVPQRRPIGAAAPNPLHAGPPAQRLPENRLNSRRGSSNACLCPRRAVTERPQQRRQQLGDGVRRAHPHFFTFVQEPSLTPINDSAEAERALRTAVPSVERNHVRYPKRRGGACRRAPPDGHADMSAPGTQFADGLHRRDRDASSPSNLTAASLKRRPCTPEHIRSFLIGSTRPASQLERRVS